MPDEVTTADAPPGTSDVNAPDAAATTSAVSLTELSQVLGESFTSAEAALKKIKNVNSERGRLARDVGELKKKIPMEDNQPAAASEGARPVLESLEAQVKELAASNAEMRFFAENPGLSPETKQTLLSMSKDTGKSLNDLFASEAIKSTLLAADAHREAEKSKTVLQSNPRLGAAKDKMSEAVEFVKQGDHGKATASAVGAVIDAFQLKG